MRLGTILAVALCLAPMQASAADFPSRVVLKVGYPAASSFDVAGRLVATHLGQFLPGHPDVSVENVAGASGARLFRSLVDNEPSDGSVIGEVNISMGQKYVLDPDGTGFDPRGLQWVGSLVKITQLCLTSDTSKVQSIDQGDLTFGTTSKGSGLYNFTTGVINGTGASGRVVLGFKSELEVISAMRRGEIDVFCGLSYSSYLRDGLEGATRILGGAGSPEILKSINATDLEAGFSASDKQAFDFLRSGVAFFYAFGLPPDVSSATLDTYRSAFQKMVADPEFVSEAKKDFAEFAPADGETVQQHVDGIYKSDPAVVARAIEMNQEPGGGN